MKEIKQIRYPNTVSSEFQNVYTVGENVDEIKYISKNGEMASIAWFEIYKDGELLSEIKESVCDIYYKIKMY